MGLLGGMPGRRKNVCEENEVIFELVAFGAGELEAIEIGERNAQVFRLAAAIGAHAGVTVSGGSAVGIGGEAGVRVSARAVEAEAAGDVEREHDAVTNADGMHRGTDLLDDAHVLMT